MMFTEPLDLLIAEMNPVREPHAIVQPTDLLEIIERPAAEMMLAILPLVGGLAEMGVQTAAVLRSERGAVDHQLLRDVERRAGRERDRPESARRAVMKLPQHALAVGNDDVMVLHQALVDEASVARAQIDR